MHSSRRSVDYRITPFDLHLVTAVLEHGTITGAAAAVNLSLAAASTRLQALEATLGVSLFERSKAGAKPTDAGRALERNARRVLNELEALHLEMAGFSQGLRGTLRLLCNTAALSEALPPRLGRFLTRHPDWDVDVQELPSDAILDALRRGVADLGIVADYVDTSGLKVRHWLDDQLVAVLPRPWATRATKSLRFADLLERPFVGLSRESGLSQFLLKQASRSGRVPLHRVRLSNFDAVAQLVAAGVGAAVMPLSAASRWQNDKLRIIPLSDAWAKRRLLICTTAASEEWASVQLLLAALLDT